VEALLYWLTDIWARLCDRPAPYRTRVADDIPEEPEPGLLYLIGEGEYLWFACFLCPCDCGELIQLNTLPRVRPRWTATRHRNGTATLHPSVRRTVGCRSHFFLRRGGIDWAKGIIE
jgi:hypothetical protein